MTLITSSTTSIKENMENPKNIPRVPPKLESKSMMPAWGDSVTCVKTALEKNIFKE